VKIIQITKFGEFITRNIRNTKCRGRKGLVVPLIYANLNKEKERKGVYMNKKSPFF
jgi:hypothetical protein